MKYVQTKTGKSNFKLGELYLISPSLKYPHIPNDICIIDCYTFYLKMYVKDQNKSFNHYKWLINFLLSLDTPHIIILPDFHNLVSKTQSQTLTNLWESYITNSSSEVLVHPNNPLYSTVPENRIIGHYMYRWDTLDNYKTHPSWTHIFGQFNCNIVPNSQLVTYDSVYNKHNSPICKLQDIPL